MKKLLSYLKTEYRFTGFTQILLLSLLVGVVAGVGAIAFDLFYKIVKDFFLLKLLGIRLPEPAGEGEAIFSFNKSRIIFLPFITALGGLVSGLLTYFFAPEAEGHGTDSAIEAYHFKRGVIRKRVPIIKLIASSFVIGTGGSAGREGPIAQIGAGFGSFISDLLKLPVKYRRILLITGVGAGIGSIFRAPFGGALFATEVLYREMDMEFEAIIASIMGAIIGYSVFGLTHSFKPIFSVPPYTFNNPFLLLPFAFLGIFLGFIAPLYVNIFYKTRDFFKDLKIPFYLKPAIGGLAVGIIGIFIPHILGMSYGWLQILISDNFPFLLLLLLPVLKIIATSLSVASGGSGGVFAPTLVTGGFLGAIIGKILTLFFPNLAPSIFPFVILGMAGFASAACNTPLAALLMVLEMTGGYGLLVPALFVIMFSYITSARESIYEKQVRNRLESPAHLGEYAVSLLERIKVKDALIHSHKPVFVNLRAHLHEILEEFSKSKTHIICVRDDGGNFIGIIPFEELRRVMLESDYLEEVLIAHDLVIKDKEMFLYEDDDLKVALQKFAESNLEELPVIKENGELVGILSRRDLLVAYSRSFLS